TVRTLLHLAQEHGYITYDDVNDVLPDNLSPEDLDALLTKLRSLDVEIVMDQAEAERAAKPAAPATTAGEGGRGPGGGRTRGKPGGAGTAGGGGRGRAPGNSRRSGPDVHEPDGQGAFAHAGTGSRDLQAHRRSRAGDETHCVQPRFHREGTHCHRGKIIVRAAEGTLRPCDRG